MTAATERAVLGAVLLAPRALRDLRDLGAEAAWFARPDHRLIWATYLAVEERGIDIVTVSSHLNDIGALDHAGGFPYLSGLTGAVPGLSNLASYAAILRDAHARRHAADRAREVLEAVERGDDLATIRPLVDAVAFPEDRSAAAGGFTNMAEHLSLASSEDAKRDEGLLPEAHPMAGLSSMDAMLKTWAEPGHRAAIAARPSMGKTLLVLQILIHIAKTRGPVAFVSRESPVRAIAKRIHKMERAAGGWMQAQRTLDQLDGRFFVIGPNDARSMLDVRDKVRRLHDETPLIAVGADYLQIFDKHTARGREDLDLAEISRVWADLIEELGGLGIMLAQLNRQVSGRTDKEPQLTDIRECGAFEQDCDSVVMLHRPAYYTGNTADKTAYAFIRKQRDDPLAGLRWSSRRGSGSVSHATDSRR